MGVRVHHLPVRTQGVLISHPPSVYIRRMGGWGFPSGGAWQGDHRLPFVSCAERSLEGLLLRRGSLDLPVNFSPTLLPPPRPEQGPHQWSWEGGEEAGRSRAEAAAAALARRGRGGAAPPPLSPNRVTGGAARVSLRAEKYGPNSQDRSRPPFTRAAQARRHRSSRPFHPGDAPPRPGPTAPAPGPALTTRPGPAGLARRGGRRPFRARDLRARRRRPSPPPPPAGGGSGGAAAVTRRPRGGKLRPLPAPPAAALPPLGTKETKPRRPGPAPLLPPPRPPGRPPPARRPGQAGSSRESQARGPKPPGTPHSSPPGSALAEGGGLHPSFAGAGGAAGAGCTTAVARATRTAAGGG